VSALLVGASLLALGLLATGCPDWEPKADAGPTPAPQGEIETSSPLSFLPPGGTVDFKGKVTCPPEFAPCTYAWDFGDGRTSTQKDPGPTLYDKLGYYPVKFTVTSAAGVSDPTPALAHVSVWSGEFKDDFNRASLGFETYGWRQPIIREKFDYHTIENNMLKITGAYHAPGSAAAMAFPNVGDFHLEVTKKRDPDDKTIHFSDIILRMHPLKQQGSFIRIRINEERAIYENFVEVGVFKIITAEDEHGWLINDDILQHQLHHIDCTPAPQYGMCPYTRDIPRTEDFKIIVDVVGNRITTRLATVKKPDEILLTAGATDDLNPPFLYEGGVGITQFEGTTLVDDFVFRRVP